MGNILQAHDLREAEREKEQERKHGTKKENKISTTLPTVVFPTAAV